MDSIATSRRCSTAVRGDSMAGPTSKTSNKRVSKPKATARKAVRKPLAKPAKRRKRLSRSQPPAAAEETVRLVAEAKPSLGRDIAAALLSTDEPAPPILAAESASPASTPRKSSAPASLAAALAVTTSTADAPVVEASEVAEFSVDAPVSAPAEAAQPHRHKTAIKRARRRRRSDTPPTSSRRSSPVKTLSVAPPAETPGLHPPSLVGPASEPTPRAVADEASLSAEADEVSVSAPSDEAPASTKPDEAPVSTMADEAPSSAESRPEPEANEGAAVVEDAEAVEQDAATPPASYRDRRDRRDRRRRRGVRAGRQGALLLGERVPVAPESGEPRILNESSISNEPRTSNEPSTSAAVPSAELAAFASDRVESKRHLTSPRARTTPRMHVPAGSAELSRTPARSRWMLAAAVSAVAALVLLLLVPVFVLARSERHVADCLLLAEQGQGEDPLRCVPSESDLMLVGLAPWLSADALKLREETHERALRLNYQLATATTPSLQARQQAAAGLLDRDNRVGFAPPLAALIEEMPGAFDAVTKAGMGSGDKEVRQRALQSARVLADVEALVVLSRGGDVTDPSRLNLERGAGLCLQKMNGEGVSALLHADRGYRIVSPQGDGYASARLAMLACGQREPSGELDPRHIGPDKRAALTALEIAMGVEGSVELGRVMLLDNSVSLSNTERLRLAALVMRVQRPKLLDALSMLAPRHGIVAGMHDAAFVSRWTLRQSVARKHGILIEPSAAREAAAHLQQLVAEVEQVPIACAGQECPADLALNMPRQLLRDAARMLLLEASREEFLRSNDAGSKAAALLALPLTSNRARHEVAALLLGAGDAKRTLAELAPQLQLVAGPRQQAAQLAARLTQLLAQAHLGRMDEAARTAGQAFEAAAAGPRGPAPPRSLKLAAAWSWAACALAADGADRVTAALRPLAQEDEELATVLSWLDIARLPEEERRPQRANYARLSPPPEALVPAMFLAGRAVADNQVEVWLDRIFDEAHRHDPVRSMRARAEAARWRGDAASASSWNDRASRLAEHIDSYEHAMLAELARLR